MRVLSVTVGVAEVPLTAKDPPTYAEPCGRASVKGRLVMELRETLVTVTV